MKIAISGSIGSGKTTVCEYLKEKGYDVFDCDEVNRNLLEEGNEGWIRVCEAFPECVEEGKLDKKKLSSLIFSDEENRKKLEGIMHPLILKKLMEREDDPLFAEVPLLFEVGWDQYFDSTLLVVTDLDLLIERMKERGYTKEETLSRLSQQMDVTEKIKRADKIIYNNGSLDDLCAATQQWLNEIL